MSTSATMDSVYTCGTFAMAVMTVETTRMKDGFAVCSYVVVYLKRRILLVEVSCINKMPKLNPQGT